MESLYPDFDFEDYVKQKFDLKLSRETAGQSAGVCKYFLKGQCQRGSFCQFVHARPEKSVVCKHWLRGLCKKGDGCEFLHEYNLKKMPECWFFKMYGECSNPDCLYLHIDPSSRTKECAWYARGFCKHGPLCRNKHVRSIACQRYITGFCPFGANCLHTQYLIYSFIFL
jgi:cleavage and polyadenylation specificity factor subunit 4